MLNTQMPIITVIGFFIILAIFLIMKSMEKRAKISGIDDEKFNSLAGDIARSNAEIKEELLIIREKVESIVKMMKDI